MPKNKHKYLAFPSVNFFGNLYSSRQMLFLSNSIFSKNSIEQIFLNVKKYFVTLIRKCSVEFFENMELKVSRRYFHLLPILLENFLDISNRGEI